MVTDTQYLKIVNEVYDLSDYVTKKNVLFCNEAKKVTNLEHIVGRLYTHIKNDVNDIDFGTIPKSKGIITKVENYDDMMDCIASIRELVDAYNQPTTPVDIFTMAIENIQKRERLFNKAFALNIELPMMIYNITVTSIISAISLLISASVEFIKEGHDSFKTSLDKVGYNRTRDHVLYEYLDQFNKNCNNGSIDKTLDACIKNNIKATKESYDMYEDDYDTLNEGLNSTFGDSPTGKLISGGIASAGIFALSTAVGQVASIIIAVGASIIAFIWMLRKIIYYFLRMRLTVSEWFDCQATLLQINAENLQYREDPKGEEHRDKVYKSQVKWVERFKKISNKFALKDSKARKEAKEDESRDYKKTTYEDQNTNSSDNYNDDDYDDGGLF